MAKYNCPGDCRFLLESGECSIDKRLELPAFIAAQVCGPRDWLATCPFYMRPLLTEEEKTAKGGSGGECGGGAHQGVGGIEITYH